MAYKPPVLKLDMLKMYFGTPYTVDIDGCEGSFTMYQPTIGEILEFGTDDFFDTLNIFVTNTTSCRLMLWDMNIDWNDFKDFHLFLLLFNQINPNVARLIFRDFDITKLQIMTKFVKDEDDNEVETFTLYNKELGIEINEDAYYYISQYLQYVFNIRPERKITNDPILKKWYIRKDRRDLENNESLKETSKAHSSSSMQAVVSACVNHPGFKYKLHELKDVGVCEFYDSVQRLKVYENSVAVLNGLHSGMVDGKNIKPESYNFMRVFE